MKILIIEDEAAAVRRLKKMITEAAPASEILADTDSIESTLSWLENNEPPDLIFMDIQLADGESFEIFNHADITVPVIFTTAYDRYAIQAFQVNAIAYLLKPIKQIEVTAALDKYRTQREKQAVDYRALAAKLRREEYDRRFLIRIGQTIKMVDVKEVAYFYTQEKITFLITKNGKRYPLDYSLEGLEELIDPARFFRINRQFIIALEAIDEMHTVSKSRVKINLQPPCDITTIVSTERSPHFKKWLTGE